MVCYKEISDINGPMNPRAVIASTKACNSTQEQCLHHENRIPDPLVYRYSHDTAHKPTAYLPA